jgi:hypothetical protein
VRPESAQKPATESLRRRHVEIVVADLASQSVEKIARLVAGYDTIISAVAASTLLDQLTLVDKGRIKKMVFLCHSADWYVGLRMF